MSGFDWRKFFEAWWWRGLISLRNHGYGLWSSAACWVTRHPGVWWYSLSGYEPDMHCVRCGEDLG